MSMLAYFMAADGHALAERLQTDPWPVVWRDPTVVLASADFSLHLSATDLDMLIESFCEARSVPAVDLTSSLVTHVAGDNDSWSIDVVAEELVRLIATTSESLVPTLDELWVHKIREEQGIGTDYSSEDALAAIKDLILVARYSQQHRLPLLHAWFL